MTRIKDFRDIVDPGWRDREGVANYQESEFDVNACLQPNGMYSHDYRDGICIRCGNEAY